MLLTDCRLALEVAIYFFAVEERGPAEWPPHLEALEAFLEARHSKSRGS